MRSNDKTLRGNVKRIEWSKVPKQSPTNDDRMRQQQDNLYGNTRMTDIQLAYFWKKHDGHGAAIKDELPFMSAQAIYNRLKDIGLPATGKGGYGRRDIKERAQIYRNIVELGGTYAEVAEELEMPVGKVKAICEKLNLKPYGAIGMEDLIFINLYVACSRNKQKVCDMTGLEWWTVDRACRRLNLS